MKTLVTICSIYPNPHLLSCVKSLHDVQFKGLPDDEFKICIVDSNSTRFEHYTEVKSNFPNVEILLAKNVNYEYGAYKLAHTLHPDYDVYICIQDNMSWTSKVDLTKLNDESAYTFPLAVGFGNFFEDFDIMRFFDGARLPYDQIDQIKDTPFVIATSNAYIVNGSTISDLFKSLPTPPEDKSGSCCYERLLGIYFTLRGTTIMDLSGNVDKIYQGRV